MTEASETDMAETETAERARRGRPPLVETSEFQEAVKKAAAEQIAALRADIFEQINKARDERGLPSAAADTGWAETFAMAIATLTDQGTGRRRVSPEILRQREQARKRMEDLIVKARVEGRAATYRLTGKVFFDEQLVDPVWIDVHHTAQPTHIDWGLVPNDAMVPVNDTAKEIYAAFIESIGSVPKEDQGAYAQQPLKVTKGGLVVLGRASPAAREVNLPGSPQPASDKPMSPDEFGGLRVAHKDQAGRYKDVFVLGTVAKPAQQSV